MKILREPVEDMWSIIFLFGHLFLQLGGILTGDEYAILFFIFLLWMTLRAAALVQHNHVHLPVFYGKVPNEIFSIACFFACGVPCDVYLVHHVVGHHRYLNQPGQDPSSIFDFPGARYPDRPVHVWRYVMTFPYRAITWSVRFLVRQATMTVRRRFYRSLVILTLLVVPLFYLHPLKSLCFVGFPWVLVWFFLGYNNYHHHAGCDMKSIDRTSWSWLKSKGIPDFEIGYHAAHHHSPGTHWSKLFKLCLRLTLRGRMPSEYVRD